MSFQHHGADANLYAPCYYREIRTPFRGPKRDLNGAYIACLGGAGHFGKFLKRSLPDILEAELGLPAVNLGQVNGGVDFMTCPEVLDVARGAIATVVDLVGAHNLSNRFYRVHPFHNDRVIGTLPPMQAVVPGLDSTDVHFTRHLLSTMQTTAPSRTETVFEDLRQVWLERMHRLFDALPGPVILLWMGGAPVPAEANDPLARLPFLDVNIVAQLADKAVDFIVVDRPGFPRDFHGMQFPADAEAQLKLLPTAREVEFAAKALLPAIRRLAPRAQPLTKFGR